MSDDQREAGSDPGYGSAVPPYEGRKESADVASKEDDDDTVKQGVEVGGAVRPRETEGMNSPDPDDTPRGEHASPADEEPAEESGGDDPGPASTGPSHYSGVPKGENRA
jgi:hypothetical protein